MLVQHVEHPRTNYPKALCAVHSVLPTNYGVNSLHYLAYSAYTVHTCFFHETGIQYMFVNLNGKSAMEWNWKKNCYETERNKGRNATEWNGPFI